MKRLYLFSMIILISYSFAAMAATITNQITGVGPTAHPIKPYVCIQDASGSLTYTLAPGASVNANQYSGNAYYVGATLRFGGCDVSNTYLGFLGLSVNAQHSNAIAGYTPPQGVPIEYANPAIDSNGIVSGRIQYKPIAPNFHLQSGEPKQNNTWSFVGVNLSGLEFSKLIDPVVIPNLSEEQAGTRFSDLNDTKAFINAGMNTIRVPLRWAYLQQNAPGAGEIDSEYFNSYVKPVLETLTTAHVNTIVDLHAYMRYSNFGEGFAGCNGESQCPDGVLIVDADKYKDVWLKLYKLMKNDPKINMNYILLDLVNEPVEVPDDLVFTIQAQVIKSLKDNGFAGYILVEGNAWSGLHSWTTSQWKSKDGKKTYTNASLFTRENFINAGITDLSKIIINVHQYLDSNYSGTHNGCLSDLTTTGANGFNLNAFTQYLKDNQLKAIVTEFGVGNDNASCTSTLNNFLIYLKNNSAKNKNYGFIGWTIWSAGHGWGDYHLRVTPRSYAMQVLQNYL